MLSVPAECTGRVRAGTFLLDAGGARAYQHPVPSLAVRDDHGLDRRRNCRGGCAAACMQEGGQQATDIAEGAKFAMDGDLDVSSQGLRCRPCRGLGAP